MSVLITPAYPFTHSSTSETWETPELAVYWEGFVFMPGLVAGRASIEQLVVAIDEHGLLEATSRLMGNYFLLVHDKATDTSYACIDRSGAYDAYYTHDAVSTSFLDLVRARRYHTRDLDKQAIVEFINFGNVYFGRTFFTDCRKIGADEVVIFRSGRLEPTRWTKQRASLQDAVAPREFLTCFADVVEALQGSHISADLTGGIDSRLLVTLLCQSGLPLETTNSGQAGADDCVIPARVASQLGVPFYRTEHDAQRFERDLWSLFVYCDGLSNVLPSHLMLQHNQARVARGRTVAISGAGGELYKDFWWMQDFPFYSSARSNLGRLFDLRFLPIPCPGPILAGELRDINSDLRQSMLRQLQCYVLGTNTETYDNIYYNVKMQTFGSRFITSYNRVIKTYAPLLELEMVRFSVGLPRSERFFNRFHRRLITQAHPGVSRMSTTEGGMSVSSEASEVLKDAPRFVWNRAQRATRKAFRRRLHRSSPQDSPNAPGFVPMVRDLGVVARCLDRLRDEGYLSSGVGACDLSETQLGTLLSMGLFLEYLDGRSNE